MFETILVFTSRGINYYLFMGDPNEMFSSRCHNEGWKCEVWIDRLFWKHNQHCRACALWEERRK